MRKLSRLLFPYRQRDGATLEDRLKRLLNDGYVRYGNSIGWRRCACGKTSYVAIELMTKRTEIAAVLRDVWACPECGFVNHHTLNALAPYTEIRT